MDEKRKGLKIKLIVAGVIIVLLGGYMWWQNYGPYDITTPKKEIGSPEEYDRFMKSLEKAWRDDHVGFTTPEETFDAFRKALKDGNYELASKYFVPQKQEEMESDFSKNINGYVDSLVDKLYLPHKIEYSESKEKVFFIVNDNKDHTFMYVLTLNLFNNIWKMEEL